MSETIKISGIEVRTVSPTMTACKKGKGQKSLQWQDPQPSISMKQGNCPERRWDPVDPYFRGQGGERQ